MATPVESPQPSAPTGGPESTAPAPEAPAPTGGAPVPPAIFQEPQTTSAPVQAPPGLPGTPAPDGVITSGRGSNADRKPEEPETPAAPEASPSPQEPQAEQRVEDLPDWAQKVIKEARDDAAKARVNAKQSAADEARKQMAQDIAKTLGIVTDETPTEEQLTPEQLRDLLAGERTTAKMARTELAVYKAAQTPGANFNASALLDSRAFLDAVKDIDPADTEAINAKIVEVVQANPWLGVAAAPPAQNTPAAPAAPQGAAPAAPQTPATPAAPAAPVAPPSGGQFAGGPGAQPQDLTTMSIDDFRRLRRNAPRS